MTNVRLKTTPSLPGWRHFYQIAAQKMQGNRIIHAKSEKFFEIFGYFPVENESLTC